MTRTGTRSISSSTNLASQIAMAIALALALAPFVTIVVASGAISTRTTGVLDFANYKSLLSNARFLDTVYLSGVISAVVAVLCLVAGLLGAAWVRHLSPVWKALTSALVSVPALVPALISGFALHAWFGRIGLDGTLWGIVAAQFCTIGPVAFFLILLALQRVDVDLEHAARNMGASEWTILYRVIVPQLASTCVAVAVLVTVLSWSEFVVTWFVAGSHQTSSVLIYGMLGSTLDPTLYAMATAVSAASFLLIGAAGVLAWREVSFALSRH